MRKVRPNPNPVLSVADSTVAEGRLVTIFQVSCSRPEWSSFVVREIHLASPHLRTQKPIQEPAFASSTFCVVRCDDCTFVQPFQG